MDILRNFIKSVKRLISRLESSVDNTEGNKIDPFAIEDQKSKAGK